MLKHILDRHEDKKPEEVKFLMKAVKFHRSAFERQTEDTTYSIVRANTIAVHSPAWEPNLGKETSGKERKKLRKRKGENRN